MMYYTLKRFFDILLSAFAVVVLSPVFLLAGIGIIISSPGPILFKAKRVGRNGKPFVMYKFRTMHLNNEKGHMITLRTDNRIFPFGRFLRNSKIDELPQLINILQGSMSIVGWRPEDIENAKKVFKGKYKKILRIKPGLTSPGSLYDYTYGETFEDESTYEKEFLPIKMELELYYSKQQSIWYDFELIARTVQTILQTLLGKSSFEAPKELHKI